MKRRGYSYDLNGEMHLSTRWKNTCSPQRDPAGIGRDSFPNPWYEKTKDEDLTHCPQNWSPRN